MTNVEDGMEWKPNRDRARAEGLTADSTATDGEEAVDAEPDQASGQ